MIPPPIRFLGLVLGAWCACRAIMLSLPEQAAAPTRGLVADARQQTAPFPPVPRPSAAAVPPSPTTPQLLLLPGTTSRGGPSAPAAVDLDTLALHPSFRMRRPLPAATFVPVQTPLLPPFVTASASPDRSWAGSAWLFLRGRAGPALAPGGTLGGSQAGGRITYAVARGGVMSARAYLPLEVPEQAEIAVGVDLQPVPALPLRVLLERRERVGPQGRSAFSATLYGGVSDRSIVGPIQVDAYAQAGMVGLRARDLFADGSARLHVRAGRAKIGAGAWAAAQPGAERLDIGPTVSLSTPVGNVQADWRFRVGGDARPGSGLAVTLSADF